MSDEEPCVPLRGIVNLVGDNYCYLNSVVQMLVRCRAVRDELASLHSAGLLTAPPTVAGDRRSSTELLAAAADALKPEAAVCSLAALDSSLGTPPATMTDFVEVDVDGAVIIVGDTPTPPTVKVGEVAPSQTAAGPKDQQPPCAALAVQRTIIEYMNTDGAPDPALRPICLTDIRRVVSYVARTYATGVMNDAAEAFECLVHVLDRDVRWHRIRATSEQPEDGHGGSVSNEAEVPFCAPSQELTRSFNGRDDDVSGVGLALGYACEARWCCQFSDCRVGNNGTLSSLEYVCRLRVYPMLNNENIHFSLEKASAKYFSFSELVRLSNSKDDVFVCTGCSGRAACVVERRWLPQGLSAFHLLWPTVPMSADVRLLLLRVLEDAAAVGVMWDSVQGVSDGCGTERKAGTRYAPLTGIVLFQGMHYVALVRGSCDVWRVLNDAKPIVEVGGWSDVVVFAAAKRLAPLMLFFDMSAAAEARAAKGPSPRPLWSGFELERRVEAFLARERHASQIARETAASSRGGGRPPGLNEQQRNMTQRTIPSYSGGRSSAVLATASGAASTHRSAEVLLVVDLDEEEAQGEGGPRRSADGASTETPLTIGADDRSSGFERSSGRASDRSTAPCDVTFTLTRKRPRGESELDAAVAKVKDFLPDFTVEVIRAALQRYNNDPHRTTNYLLEIGVTAAEREMAECGSAVRESSSPSSDEWKHCRPRVSSPQLQPAARGQLPPVSFMTDPCGTMNLLRLPVHESRAAVKRQQQQLLPRASGAYLRSSPRKALFLGKSFTIVFAKADTTAVTGLIPLVAELKEENTVIAPGSFRLKPTTKSDNNSEYVLTTPRSLELLARGGDMGPGKPYAWLPSILMDATHMVLSAVDFLQPCVLMVKELRANPSPDTVAKVNGLNELPKKTQLRSVCSFSEILALVKSTALGPHHAALRNGLEFRVSRADGGAGASPPDGGRRANEHRRSTGETDMEEAAIEEIESWGSAEV